MKHIRYIKLSLQWIKRDRKHWSHNLKPLTK